jgi:NADPH-dependent 2,4-dienoyl-CoA reductase/sulfur reductase-like enzyme
MMSITRRQMLKVIGGTGLAGVWAVGLGPYRGLMRSLVTSAAPGPLLPAAARRVVVLGGGISGAMCARTLRRLAPDVEVVVIERNPTYVSGPSHVDFVVGLEDRAKMTVGFDGLAKAGVKVIHAAATAIRPAENRLVTASGFVDYTHLVVATGMVPANNDIAGLLENAPANQHAWTWPGTLDLARAVQGFGGGTFVLSVPPPPYKCPPGPYEVACLIDEFWKAKGVRAEIIVVDANDRPQPPIMADLWRTTLAGRRIAYKPSFKVVEFDAARRTLVSDRGERQRYDLASVIPPAKGPLFLEESGLDYPFIDVDPMTFRTRRYANISAVGDVTRTPYPKTAFVGFLEGRNVAYYIARAFGVDRGEPDPVYNQCWPFVSSKEALFVEVAWTKEGRPIPERTKVLGIQPEHVGRRKSWEYGILAAAYG